MSADAPEPPARPLPNEVGLLRDLRAAALHRIAFYRRFVTDLLQPVLPPDEQAGQDAFAAAVRRDEAPGFELLREYPTSPKEAAADTRAAVPVESFLSPGERNEIAIALESIRDAIYQCAALDDALEVVVCSADASHLKNDEVRAIIGVYHALVERIEQTIEKLASSAQDPPDEVPVVGPKEAVVLRILHSAYPRLMTLEGIGDASAAEHNEVSVRKIQPIISDLIDRGLAERPNGPKSGVALTAAGMQLAARLRGG